MTSIAYNLKQATEACGLPRTSLYAAMRAGRLTARKSGRRTLILADDLVAYVRSLPVKEVRTNA